ncbi:MULTISPECIES: acetyl-CoA carboxylase biotin carboxylase subunit [Selenomonas]|jgi:acetyl-CoA carboxylase biotin carboxylase subunit|uniref:biotin carboxylase n=1 Tax=Selenomonas ruminantium TaxID=971 RepID=A0A1K1QQ05_SELRU|nr:MULTISPECIES: acetyl-CoA carboxylase biotin carboxylase subunit [Selenomonas]MBE6084600.1 acetyl-CoA carboxylase biotin carboxylase subunit [Selenomonas ruminantium]SDZ83857.1 acetyl-CoA carboxylase, biotin carboxylase subunit [Selenomonas ruminantium]SFW61829.1 acetyl-CoA carboxylase, biotin carboxylase subunit [Selenomonas ruminantium]
MFKRILIANRGEIAVRIIRACQELDIETVAVYSDADANALHVRLADMAVNVGPEDALESYLNKPAILKAARETHADAIHPGYGFLSEDADFAEQVTEAGITWIGPMPETIRLVGDKDIARASIAPSGIPMAKGSDPLTSNEEAIKVAAEVGYPVILKPVSGGGGKGMCVAHDENDLKNILNLLVDITKTKYYFEHYIERSRHIEVQIVADNYGEVLHLGERECSLQRRNQKLLEESPSIALTQDMRNRVGRLAVKAAKSVHYSNIGTVEFLLDLSNNEFYFMEINPRIQVEHGITEAVTGIDLVRTQIRIAAGEALEITQEDVNFTGHAIECRINAEDPENNFMPCPGQITFLHEPSGPRVRFDSGVTAGLSIEPYYDSMIAKIIVHGRTRGDAIKIMERALKEFRIDGVKTTVSLHKKILKDTYFRTGNIDTQFIKKRMDAYEAAPKDTKDMNEEELANTISESMYFA